MAYSAADLLKLQANIKRDPDGYRDEFLMQYRHYEACLQIFQLNPGQDSKEFAEFITFIAQVSKVYRTSTAGFAPQLMALLEAQAGRLDPPLRRALVSSLILLRNRNQLDPLVLLPLLFKLFRVNDKALREMLFRHIIADLKASNKKGRNERLNRGVQSFLYNMVNGDEPELAAKKALAVLSELWRRRVWRDARTVNCIASAVFHKSPRVMAAALKFFLGQDAAAAAGDDDDDEDDDDEGGGSNKAGGGGNKGVTAVAAPTKEEVYKAMHKGTKSSKRKKQAKLKRVMASLKKAARKDAAAGSEGFAALHLLHDPQGFAERLFSRLQVSRERWETRLDMMNVTSRVVGVHQLLLLNLYPFLQKYIAPHQRDVTAVLAALVMASHPLVPPDTLAPVLRQLVDQFVHDRARPEVMTVGLKAVRELSLRCPLVMNPELMQDLAEYKKFRDKEVATAARSLIGAFREMNPELLAKKDRGRGADLASGPAGYGAAAVADRLEGADLLEAALAAGSSDGGSSDGELGIGSDDSDDGEDESSGSGDASSEDEGEESGDDEDESSAGDGEEEEDAAAAASGSSSESERESEGEREEGEEGPEASSSQQEEDDSSAAAAAAAAAAAEERQNGSGAASTSGSKQQQQQPGSLSSLKKQLAAAKQQKQQQQQQAENGAAAVGDGDRDAQQQLPLEMTCILTEDDFRRIRELKRRALIKAALSRHGLASASEAKKRRLMAAAEAEADEALALAGKRARLTEAQVAPDDLTGRHKRRADKQERLASVMSGREGREAFGARSKLKKKKSGGLSERQKQRQKSMPIAARVQQLKNRSSKARQKNNPRHFKGHIRK